MFLSDQKAAENVSGTSFLKNRKINYLDRNVTRKIFSETVKVEIRKGQKKFGEGETKFSECLIIFKLPDEGEIKESLLKYRWGLSWLS